MPPGIKPVWEENDVCQQSLLIAYNQIREYESVGDDSEQAKL